MLLLTSVNSPPPSVDFLLDLGWVGFELALAVLFLDVFVCGCPFFDGELVRFLGLFCDFDGLFVGFDVGPDIFPLPSLLSSRSLTKKL